MIVLRLPDCWSRTEGMVRIGRMITVFFRERVVAAAVVVCAFVYIYLFLSARGVKRKEFLFLFFFDIEERRKRIQSVF